MVLIAVGVRPAIAICPTSTLPVLISCVTALPTAFDTPAGSPDTIDVTAFEASCPITGAIPPLINPFPNSPPVASATIPLYTPLTIAVAA